MTLTSIWQALDGYKSAIGIISTALVTASEQMGWLPAGSTQFWTLFLTALGITVVGVVHKQMKLNDAQEATATAVAMVKNCDCPPRV